MLLAKMVFQPIVVCVMFDTMTHFTRVTGITNKWNVYNARWDRFSHFRPRPELPIRGHSDTQGITGRDLEHAWRGKRLNTPDTGSRGSH